MISHGIGWFIYFIEQSHTLLHFVMNLIVQGYITLTSHVLFVTFTSRFILFQIVFYFTKYLAILLVEIEKLETNSYYCVGDTSTDMLCNANSRSEAPPGG